MVALSIIISSRCDTYLQRTVDDLLNKAEGEVEVIVVLDGIWPDPMLKDSLRVNIVHQGEFHDNLGMRAAINAGVRLSRGQYIMKVDEHVMMSPGYDKRLISICEDEWIIVPRRYRLDADKWEIINDGRNPIDYMIIDYPYQRPHDKTCGLHGAEDAERYKTRKDIEVDDLMTMQGSAYFCKKTYWEKLFPDGMDEENYGPFTQEAQEVSMTAWLSGGRVVVDKGCYYCHLHKGSKHGKGYGFSTTQYKRHMVSMEKGRLYCINKWLYTTDYKYDFEWLLKKFWPIKGWTDSWKEDIIRDREYDYSTLNYEGDYWLGGLRES